VQDPAQARRRVQLLARIPDKPSGFGGREVKPLALIVALVSLALSAVSESPMKSYEREKQGFRGPVKVCVEETTYPAGSLSDGRDFPESKRTTRTEFDEQGRILSTGAHTSSCGAVDYRSEWVTRYEYSPSGMLLRVSTENQWGEPAVDTVYLYDDLGRLENIQDNTHPENPVFFRYDERGRKRKIANSRPHDYMPPNAAISLSTEPAFELDGREPNLPSGGGATTLYDQKDRPTEVHVRDARGVLISRTVRVYDDQDRVVEEKQTKNRVLDSSGATADRLRGASTRSLADQQEVYSIRYSYDTQGRKSKTVRKVFNGYLSAVETTYNDMGDVDVEVSRGNFGAMGKTPNESQYSEEHFSYQYDSNGNWTERKVTYRRRVAGQESLEDTGIPPTVTRRTLEYF
jgi:hypothetical protein